MDSARDHLLLLYNIQLGRHGFSRCEGVHRAERRIDGPSNLPCLLDRRRRRHQRRRLQEGMCHSYT